VRGDDALKRVIDVVGASTALLLLSPLLAVVALLVRVRMGAPVCSANNDRDAAGVRS